MAFSVFDDPTHPPAADDLARALGPAARLWSELIARARSLSSPLAELWKHGGARSGWSLRVARDERVILYLTPHTDSFSAGIVLGESAARAASESSLPPLALQALESAPRYAEGRGVRIAVSTPPDLEAVVALLPHKLATPRRRTRPPGAAGGKAASRSRMAAKRSKV